MIENKMNKNQIDSLKTRENLLQAALLVFDRQGVARASLQEIATQAGLTRGALYWHFKNKEDIFAALCVQQLQKLAQKVAFPQQQYASWEEAYSGFYRFFSVLEADEEIQQFLRIIHLKCEHTEHNRAILNVLQTYRQMRDERLQQLIEYGKEAGKVSADLPVHFGVGILRTVLVGLEVSWLTCADFPLSTVAKMVFDQCLLGLVHSGSLNS